MKATLAPGGQFMLVADIGSSERTEGGCERQPVEQLAHQQFENGKLSVDERSQTVVVNLRKEPDRLRFELGTMALTDEIPHQRYGEASKQKFRIREEACFELRRPSSRSSPFHVRAFSR